MQQGTSAFVGRPGGESPFERWERRLLPWATVVVALLAWQAATWVFAIPAYVLPPPSSIASTLVDRANVLAPAAAVTGAEILGGFGLGTSCGMALALAMARARRIERALGPLLVVAQALPVFAIAPLLVVWFGFGPGSKLAMSGLIIFFPVTTSFFEGLRRTDPGLIDVALLNRATRRDTLMLIRVPAALPALATGLRVAAAVAPLGAVVGEWVGSSSGLGLLMLHANARMETDMVFAALAVLVAISIALWAAVGAVARRLMHWAPDTLSL